MVAAVGGLALSSTPDTGASGAVPLVKGHALTIFKYLKRESQANTNRDCNHFSLTSSLARLSIGSRFWRAMLIYVNQFPQFIAFVSSFFLSLAQHHRRRSRQRPRETFPTRATSCFAFSPLPVGSPSLCCASLAVAGFDEGGAGDAFIVDDTEELLGVRDYIY